MEKWDLPPSYSRNCNTPQSLTRQARKTPRRFWIGQEKSEREGRCWHDEAQVRTCGLHYSHMESQNHKSWKIPLRSLSSALKTAPSHSQLNHAPRCHIYTPFEHFQAWWLHHCCGQTVPVPGHPSSEGIFPTSQSKCAMVQLEAISSGPVTFVV